MAFQPPPRRTDIPPVSSPTLASANPAENDSNALGGGWKSKLKARGAVWGKKAVEKGVQISDNVGGKVNNYAEKKFGTEHFWPVTGDFGREMDKCARILRAFTVEGVITEEPAPSGTATPTDPSDPSSPNTAAAAAATSRVTPSPDIKGKTKSKSKTSRKVLRKIPPKVIANAKGLVIFTAMRTGIAPFGGAGGAGVVIARLPDGSWSAPSSISPNNLSAGFLLGIDVYDAVLIINSAKALESFKTHKATIGAEMGLAAGPYGSGVSMEAGLEKAPIWSYVKSRGMYAGVEVVGQVFVERFDENAGMYHWPGVKAGDILTGRVKVPPQAAALHAALHDAETGIAQSATAIPDGAEVVQNPQGEMIVPDAGGVRLNEGEVLNLPPTPSMLAAGPPKLPARTSRPVVRQEGQQETEGAILPHHTHEFPSDTAVNHYATEHTAHAAPRLASTPTTDASGIPEGLPPAYNDATPDYGAPAHAPAHTELGQHDLQGYPDEKAALKRRDEQEAAAALLAAGSASSSTAPPISESKPGTRVLPPPPAFSHFDNSSANGGVEEMSESERREWAQAEEDARLEKIERERADQAQAGVRDIGGQGDEDLARGLEGLKLLDLYQVGVNVIGRNRYDYKSSSKSSPSPSHSAQSNYFAASPDYIPHTCGPVAIPNAGQRVKRDHVMAEPTKPKRRVTAQIPLASTSVRSTAGSSTGSNPSTPTVGNAAFARISTGVSTTASSSSSISPVVRARAHVDPAATALALSPTAGSGPGTSHRPTLRSTPSSTSTTSLRSSSSLPAVPPTRSKSPVRVRSPLLPSSTDTPPLPLPLPAQTLTARAKVRPSSPSRSASPKLGGDVRAKTRVVEMGSNPTGQVPSGTSGEMTTRPGVNRGNSSGPFTPTADVRPRIVKAATSPITAPSPSTRSRALSNVSVSGTARVRPSDVHRPSEEVPPVPPLPLPLPSPTLPVTRRPLALESSYALDRQASSSRDSGTGSPSIHGRATINAQGHGRHGGEADLGASTPNMGSTPQPPSTPRPSTNINTAVIPSSLSLSQPSTPLFRPARPLVQSIAQDPTASCPPTPLHPLGPSAGAGAGSGAPARSQSITGGRGLSSASPSSSSSSRTRRRMPGHPLLAHPAARPVPASPEFRTVDLPAITPVRTRDSIDGSVVGGYAAGIGGMGVDDGIEVLTQRIIGLGIEHGPEAAAHQSQQPNHGGIGEEQSGGEGSSNERDEVGDGEHGNGFGDSGGPLLPDADVNGDTVVEEARINRKVADLEISNASLLAINRSLEISKSKQRAEILRLRRALRESLSNPMTTGRRASSAATSASASSPLATVTGSMAVDLSETAGAAMDDDDEDGSGFTVNGDEEADNQWNRAEELVTAMHKRAESAVKRVQEDVKPAGRAVLSWHDEVEDGPSTGFATPEKQGEG